jgi:hypothetical protein
LASGVELSSLTIGARDASALSTALETRAGMLSCGTRVRPMLKRLWNAFRLSKSSVETEVNVQPPGAPAPTTNSPQHQTLRASSPLSESWVTVCNVALDAPIPVTACALLLTLTATFGCVLWC